jgi:hypothetical protein
LQRSSPAADDVVMGVKQQQCSLSTKTSKDAFWEHNQSMVVGYVAVASAGHRTDDR